MTSVDARQAARNRSRLRRVRDEMDALPDGRAIERALAESLKAHLARAHGGDLKRAVEDCAVVRALLDGALRELNAQRYDMKNPAARGNSVGRRTA